MCGGGFGGHDGVFINKMSSVRMITAITLAHAIMIASGHLSCLDKWFVRVYVGW